MYAFEYHRPTSVKEAANLAGQAEDTKFLAGGHTLLPTMKLRLAAPANLIDLGQIAELRGIERSGDTITIGAMTKHAEVANSAEVKEAIPALAEMAELIGDPHVRNRGTIGGSIANNDPSADYPAACLASNATIVTNKRKIAADDFFQGIFDDGAGGGRDHHPGVVPGPLSRQPTPSSATRPRATPWSACSWPSMRMACASP